MPLCSVFNSVYLINLNHKKNNFVAYLLELLTQNTPLFGHDSNLMNRLLSHRHS